MVKKRILEAELAAAGWTKMDHKNGKHDKWTKPGMRPITVSRGGSGSQDKGVHRQRNSQAGGTQVVPPASGP